VAADTRENAYLTLAIKKYAILNITIIILKCFSKQEKQLRGTAQQFEYRRFILRRQDKEARMPLLLYKDCMR
jgi:hypothetical protein